MKNTKASKAITVIIIFVMIIIAGLIFFTYRNRILLADGGSAAPAAQSPPRGAQGTPGGAGQGGPGMAAGRNATAVRVAPVSRGTIEKYLVVNGDVIMRTQVSIFPTVGGKLTEIRLQPGDTVWKGQTVAMVDPSRPGEVYSQSPVVSTITGTILQAPVNPGDTVSVQTPIYLVGDPHSLVVETFIPERFATVIRRGLEAQTTFEAMSGEIFPASVDEVSPMLDPASRTLKIRLRFNREDPRIKAGMFVTLSLVTESATDILVIPREAVINTYGSWIVFVVGEDNRAERREITLGLENETLVEVTSGAVLGEKVVIAGQNFLTDKDPVRILD
ncbi:efflux RND transporter periplasmic adaptor subunit [Treponema sp. TIM-1]|uniref:efflux RND transporter periplasmic adaptor subunit n=1 Tax=Treponema sp. TIM-1 TaxID=2898417 RepID=UPI0039801BF1